MSFQPFNGFSPFGFSPFGGGAFQSVAERYRAAVMTDSPVAYWRLGEASGTVAADETASYNGTYVGGITLGASGAFAGDSAVVISAQSERMARTDDPALRLANTGCVECWVRMPNINGGSRFYPIVCKGYLSGWAFAIDHRNPTSWVSWRGSAAMINSDWPANALLRAGGWLHLVVAWSPGIAEAWINGASQGQIVVPNVTSQTHQLRIGNDQLLSGHTLVGSIDEVAIYPSPLSPARIAAHYAAAGY